MYQFRINILQALQLLPINPYHSCGLENTSSWDIHWSSASKMFSGYSDIRGVRSVDAGDSWSFNYTGHTQNSMYKIFRRT